MHVPQFPVSSRLVRKSNWIYEFKKENSNGYYLKLLILPVV
jgi:hypothetical protein